MKKLLPYILLLAAIATALYFILSKNQNSVLDHDPDDFAIEDTSLVDKLFLADKNGNTTTLIEKGNIWYVKDKGVANKDRVDQLLATIKRVRVKNPTPKSAMENVIKDMAGSSVKIEIYQKGKLYKSYFVGGTTPDELGTYMAMNNEDKLPFVTHIPGFFGYLNTRYFADEDEWLTKKIFGYNPTNIQEVKVEYPDSQEYSFQLQKNGSEFELSSSVLNLNSSELSRGNAIRFLLNFEDFQYEKRLKERKSILLDSLNKEQAIARVSVRTLNNEDIHTVTFYPIYRERVNPDAKNKYYIFRLFAMSSKRPDELFTVQKSLLNKILLRPDYFSK